MKKILLIAFSAILLLASCSSNDSGNISGAGATFPEPFYKMAFKKYGSISNVNINYGAIGSGGGYRSLKDKTVDFGASDVFLSDDEISALGAKAIHIPTTMGAVVLSYNLPGVQSLNLNHELITKIFLGQITNWNAPEIKAVNPDITLPDQAITVVYRSDGSGTTAVFSQYMSSVNSDWQAQIGQGKSLNFPMGVSAKGNAGVSGMIAQTQGAIGYIGSEYALALDLPTASVCNSAGNYIKASASSISKAADIPMPADTRILITNAANPDAYPISSFTWIVVYQEQSYNNRTV